MRIFSAALPLALVACGQGEQEAARVAEERAAEAAPKFFCAHGPGEMIAACTAERTRTNKGWTMTIRHSDGHFRRLLVSTDGARVTAADGAETATMIATGRQMEITVGGDRYRLPTLR